MGKDDMVQFLQAHGYRAANENGIVMIHVETSMSAKKLGELNTLIRNSGYNSSWGVKKDAEVDSGGL